MDQMNVSITDHLVDYVRKQVKSGRYNNASEVVRDALRRMEAEEAREMRLATPVAEDLVANLMEDQRDVIRLRVRASIEEIKRSEFTDYIGREGLEGLAAGVKARGRGLLAKSAQPRK